MSFGRPPIDRDELRSYCESKLSVTQAVQNASHDNNQRFVAEGATAALRDLLTHFYLLDPDPNAPDCKRCSGSGSIYLPPNRLLNPRREASHVMCGECDGTGKQKSESN